MSARSNKRNFKASARESPKTVGEMFSDSSDGDDLSTAGLGAGLGIPNPIPDPDEWDGDDDEIGMRKRSNNQAQKPRVKPAVTTTGVSTTVIPQKIVWTRSDCGGTDITSLHEPNSELGMICDSMTCLVTSSKTSASACGCVEAPKINYPAYFLLLKAIEDVTRVPGHASMTNLYVDIANAFNAKLDLKIVAGIGHQTLRAHVTTLMNMAKSYAQDNPFGHFLGAVIASLEAKTTKPVKGAGGKGGNHDTTLSRIATSNDQVADSVLRRNGASAQSSSSSLSGSAAASSASSSPATVESSRGRGYGRGRGQGQDQEHGHSHGDDMALVRALMAAPAVPSPSPSATDSFTARSTALSLALTSAESSATRALAFLNAVGSTDPEARRGYIEADTVVKGCQAALSAHVRSTI